MGQKLARISHIGLRVYNLGDKGSNPTQLCHMTCHKKGIITYVQLLGTPPL